MSFYTEEIDIGEMIIKLTPADYEGTLKVARETYKKDKTAVCEAVENALTHLPGIFIQLTFIVDLSEEEPQFIEDVTQSIEKIMQTKDPNQLLNLLINLYFLSEYGYFAENELQDLLFKNNLQIYQIFLRFSISKQYIEKTKKPSEKNFSLKLPNTFLSDDVKSELLSLVAITQNKPADILIALQIIKTFSFSHLDCRSYLLNYFFNNEYTSVIHAIFIHYASNRNDKIFVSCLFIGFCRVEAFLSTFYRLLPEIEESEELINTIIQLLYEKFYYPQKETKSFYKEYSGYDPVGNEVEKNMFLESLNAGMIECIKQTSNLDILRQVVKPNQLCLINFQKVIDCDVIDLKQIIISGKFDDIKKFERDDFYKSFLSIGQNSISHFLGYMEILKEYFVMNDEEQKKFYNLMHEVYSGRRVLMEVTTQKMLKFVILNVKNIGGK